MQGTCSPETIALTFPSFKLHSYFLLMSALVSRLAIQACTLHPGVSGRPSAFAVVMQKPHSLCNLSFDLSSEKFARNAQFSD